MLALSMYVRLNEDRKVVLDKIDESGTIYKLDDDCDGQTFFSI